MLGEKGVPGIAGPRVRVLVVIFISPVKTTCFCVHFCTFVTEVRYTTVSVFISVPLVPR